MGNGQNVQNRVRRATHGNIQTHGIHKSLARSNIPWKYRIVALMVIFFGDFDYLFRGFFKQFQACCVCGYNGSVSRKGKTQSFVQTIHGVCREHTGARSASWTGVFFNPVQFFCRS